MLYLLCFASLAPAAVLSANSVTGPYFLRHVEFTTDNSNNIADARSIIGSTDFDGAGNYSFTGQQAIGTGAASSYSI